MTDADKSFDQYKRETDGGYDAAYHRYQAREIRRNLKEKGINPSKSFFGRVAACHDRMARESNGKA